MSDDLRTRIAAAIMDSCHGVYLDDAVNAADAVISELGLREQRTLTELVTDPYSGATWTREGGRRYVTEWESDDKV